MVTLIKLGGSLITDKTQEATLRADVLNRLAQEVADGIRQHSSPMIIGHGSGSYGHFMAKRYDTINGVQSAEQWAGFASVNRVASELNFHVATAFGKVGVPVIHIQPSASALAIDGQVDTLAMQPIERALAHDLIPLVYGDVAFDDKRGGTILSTETIFRYLVSQLPVKQIFLLGDVDGVYDEQKDIIPHITLKNFKTIQQALGGSGGVDVTGGMLTKVQDMLDLASHPPYPDVYIVNGLIAGRLRDCLAGRIIGTHISR